MTPQWKPFALSLSRRSYNACFAKAVESKDFKESVVEKLVRKEMEYLNSHPSLLKDSPKVLQKFNWHSLNLELKQTIPTLWSILESLLPKPNQKFICFIISMILKMQCKHLCHVQKAVSILLHGNGIREQVLLSFYVSVWFLLWIYYRSSVACNPLW